MLRLNVHDPLLHFVPCQIIQFTLQGRFKYRLTICSVVFSKSSTHIHNLKSSVVKQFNVVELDEVVHSPDKSQGQKDGGQCQGSPSERCKAR